MSLFYVEQLSVREIATSMKLSEGAVKYHLHAGVRAPRMAGAGMTDDFDFDPLESELRRRFDTLEPAPDDPDAVLDAMRPRLRRAQRNHRIATSAAVDARGGVRWSSSALPRFGAATAASVRVTPPAAQLAVGVDHDRAARSRARPTVSTPAGRRSRRPREATARPVRTQPDPTGTQHADERDRAGDRHPQPEPTTAPVSSDTPYSSAGGSIVVHRSGSTISLGSSTPAAGYTQEVHDNGPTRVEVRFNNGQTEWRIRVDLVNGELQAETTQH